MNTLNLLKEQYKNTLIEPRLSGKFLREDLLKSMIDKIDAATTLEDFILAIPNAEQYTSQGDACKHIFARILAWENEPPFIK